MTMRLIAVLALALAGVSPASAVEVLTGTLRSVAERGEIVLGYRESSVPFSFVEGKRPEARASLAELRRVARDHGVLA